MLEILLAALPMTVCAVMTVQLWLDIAIQRTCYSARCWLAVFMSTSTLLYLGHFIYFNHLHDLLPVSDIVYVICNLAVYPLYLIYIYRLTDRQWQLQRSLRLLLPSLIGGLAVTYLYMMMDGDERQLFTRNYLYLNDWSPLSGLTFAQACVHHVCKVVFAIQVLYVAWRGWHQLKRYDQDINAFYADTDGKVLRPIRMLLAVFALTSLMSTIFNFIGRYVFLDTVWLLIPALLFSVLLLLIGYVGLRYDFSITDLLLDEQQESKSVDETLMPYERLAQRISDLMDVEQMYLQNNLKVTDLTRKLRTNRLYVQRAIKYVLGMSFSELVNRHRVNYARNLMAEHPEMPVSEVAQKSGFSSLSSFYRNMKLY